MLNICGLVQARAHRARRRVYASEKPVNEERCTFRRKEQKASRVLFRTMVSADLTSVSRRHARGIYRSQQTFALQLV